MTGPTDDRNANEPVKPARRPHSLLPQPETPAPGSNKARAQMEGSIRLQREKERKEKERKEKERKEKEEQERKDLAGRSEIRMDFNVHTPEGVHSYRGASYALNSEGPGTLRVQTAGGNVILYGPTGWHWLEEVPPTPPAPSPPPPMDSLARAIQEIDERVNRQGYGTGTWTSGDPRPRGE